VRGRAGLLERERVLRDIEALLNSAASSEARALLIEGHAGMGKTRLHEAALDRARTGDLVVLHAAGSELERNLAFGVAGQLLRSLLRELPERERKSVVAEAPQRIKSLLRGEESYTQGEGLAVSHGLFSLLAAALEDRPALLAVDDLHWCDSASLELVLYLLHRLGELPLALLLTRRPEGAEERDRALDYIAAHPRLSVATLRPLGLGAVRRLMAEALGKRPDERLAELCLEATAGNPFYLHELLLALAGEPQLTGDALAQRVRRLAPDAVTRSLRVRVGRLGPDAAALARAVSILGDDVPLRHAAALSGLDVASASKAADALASVEVLLAREPLRFVHPLVRRAIEHDIPASERSGRHRDAARLLYAEGVDAEHVAAHLLLGRAEGDPWVVDHLREAAREASSRAAPQSAIRYLERALTEPPFEEVRPRVMAELGRAEAAAGLPVAAKHLRAAMASASERRDRAELALALGQALYAQGVHDEAASAFEEGLHELIPGDPESRELHDELQTGYVATASIVPALQAKAVKRSAELLAAPPDEPITHGRRLLLAQAAVHASFAGEPAEKVLELGERGWDDGRLLETETSDGVGWSLLTAAFCLAGDLERSVDVSDAALADARRRDAPIAFATASYVRCLPQLWQGRVSDAVADVELARGARRFGWRQFARAAAAHYCLCLIETGDFEKAESVLTEDRGLEAILDLEDVIRIYALSELRLNQGQHQEALDTALRAGAAAEASVPFLGYCPWRSVAAQALLALGDRHRALELAREAHARAGRTRALHMRIRTLRVLGMCEGGEAGLERLRAAVELGSSSPPRLDTIRALIELGAALRRANERAAAREPLTEAADLAAQSGASALAERARLELSATGARPRREALLTGPAALTPSERRIAELAANGRSNREIASALFVTPKTVEYHLRNAYRKLGIEKRSQLAGALGA
jgi:DNA-binding CsgD family transcriptional regulator